MIVGVETKFLEISAVATPIDGFTDGKKRDQASVRRQHMTVKGDEVASFLVLAERRPRAPQPPDTSDTAASNLLSEQTRLRIRCWDPSSKRGSPRDIENRVAGRWHTRYKESAELLQHEDIKRQFHVPHSRVCAALNKHTFEP